MPGGGRGLTSMVPPARASGARGNDRRDCSDESSVWPGVGTRRRRRHRLREDGRRRASGRAVPRGVARGGAEVLHRPLRRAGLRGRPARAADQVRGDVPGGGQRVGEDRARPGGGRQRGRRPGHPARRTLDSFAAVIGEQREARKVERAQKQAEAKVDKERIVARPRSSPPAPTGATAPTGCATCSTSGRRSPASTAPPTTPCGGGSRRRGRRTPRRASRTSPSSTRSVRARARSRSGWSRRPRPWRARPSGVRRRVSTAT